MADTPMRFGSHMGIGKGTRVFAVVRLQARRIMLH